MVISTASSEPIYAEFNAVSNYANSTLTRLANFLEYAELPESARQVRSLRDIFQHIMQVEQRKKLTHYMLNAATGGHSLTVDNPPDLSADGRPNGSDARFPKH